MRYNGVGFSKNNRKSQLFTRKQNIYGYILHRKDIFTIQPIKKPMCCLLLDQKTKYISTYFMNIVNLMGDKIEITQESPNGKQNSGEIEDIMDT